MEFSTQDNTDLDLQQSITSNDHPSTDMSFRTIEDAENFYYRYASRIGFSVRKSTTSSNTHGITRRTLVCSKKGKSNAIVPSSTTSSKKNGILEILELDARLKLHLLLKTTFGSFLYASLHTITYWLHLRKGGFFPQIRKSHLTLGTLFMIWKLVILLQANSTRMFQCKMMV
ncbi:hypothetical protein ZOSMA_78G00340 [Zostera marina]|uniref:FAR1 domain-containing protein n=1 Tax=Zostera marina TaxID=29655 RepID=A0A0K9NND0_ZOSMR|nr:hypothetical protein ZOSMA_78G00340 [Zostera marina]